MTNVTITAHTPLHAIATAVEHDWANVNYAARPYLDAMHALEALADEWSREYGFGLYKVA